jgi:hypothetical protein
MCTREVQHSSTVSRCPLFGYRLFIEHRCLELVGVWVVQCLLLLVSRYAIRAQSCRVHHGPDVMLGRGGACFMT